MSNLILSTDAKKDLADIKRYITENLENPKAALSVLSKITDNIRLLRSHPLIGTPLTSIAKTDTDYRYLVSGSYMVFYRVSGKDVYVDRVLYGRRDYLNALLGDTSPEIMS